VSFYNQGESGKAIPPSPVVACAGVIEDYSRCRSIQWKSEGNVLYLVGEPRDELGGSEYYRVIYGTLGANVPEADFIRERRQIATVLEMYRHGWVSSCHDVGQGGLLTTIAEMMLGGKGEGRLGLTLDLNEFSGIALPHEKILFSETGAFILELPAGMDRDVLALCARNNVRLFRLGELMPHGRLEVMAGDERRAVWEREELKQAYMFGCRKIFGT
jgi:phosphoribosylformylglycinamidine synthase